MELRFDEFIGVGGALDAVFGRKGGFEAFEGDAEGGFELDGPGLADAFDLHQFFDAGLEELFQRSLQSGRGCVRGRVLRPFTLGAGAEDDGDELGEGEGVDPFPQEALAGPFIERDL